MVEEGDVESEETEESSNQEAVGEGEEEEGREGVGRGEEGHPREGRRERKGRDGELELDVGREEGGC